MIRRRAKFSAVPVALAARTAPKTPADSPKPQSEPLESVPGKDTTASLTSSETANDHSSEKVAEKIPEILENIDSTEKLSTTTHVIEVVSEANNQNLNTNLLMTQSEIQSVPFMRRSRTRLAPKAAISTTILAEKTSDSKRNDNDGKTTEEVPKVDNTAKPTINSNFQQELSPTVLPAVEKENRNDARLNPVTQQPSTQATKSTSDEVGGAVKTPPSSFRRGKFKIAPKVLGGVSKGSSPLNKTESGSTSNGVSGALALTPSSRHTNSVQMSQTVHQSLTPATAQVTSPSPNTKLAVDVSSNPTIVTPTSTVESQVDVDSPLPANFFQRRPKSRLLPASVKLNISECIKARSSPQSVEKSVNKAEKGVTFHQELVQISTSKEPNVCCESLNPSHPTNSITSNEQIPKPILDTLNQANSAPSLEDPQEELLEMADIKELSKKKRKLPTRINMQELKSRRSTLTLGDMISCKVSDAKRMDPKFILEDPNLDDIMRAQLNRRHIRKLDTNATEYVSFDPIKKEFIELTKREPSDGSVVSKTEVQEPNNNNSETGTSFAATSEESSGILAPRLKMGEDGRFVLDEESLVIEQTSELNVSSGVVTQSSSVPLGTYQKSLYHFDYRNTKGLNIKWSESELKRFYMAVQMVGLDFQMLMTLIPDRSYKEMRSKFSTIDKSQSSLADKLLSRPLKYDQLLLKSRYKAELRSLSRENYEKRKLKLQFEAKRRNDREHFKEWFLDRDFMAEAIELQKVRDSQEKNIGRKRKRLITEVPLEGITTETGVAAIEPAKQAKTCRRKKQDSKLNLAKVSVNETLVNSLVPDEIQAPLDEPEDSSIMAHVSVGGAKKIKAKNRIGRPPMSSTIRNQSAIQMSIDAALERYNLYKNSPQKLVHMADQILLNYPNSQMDSAESDVDGAGVAAASPNGQSTLNDRSCAQSRVPLLTSPAAVKFNGYKNVEPFSGLLEPQQPVDIEQEALTGITVQVQCKKAKRKKKVKLKEGMAESTQTERKETVPDISIQSHAVSKEEIKTPKKPAKKKSAKEKNESAVVKTKKTKKLSIAKLKSAVNQKNPSDGTRNENNRRELDEASETGVLTNETGMEKEARETMDENESCAAISEDVPLPFSPSSVLRSVEETPDLSSLLQTPKKEDETPNTTQTPGTSSIQGLNQELGDDSTELQAQEVREALESLNDVTKNNDVTRNDDVTRNHDVTRVDKLIRNVLLESSVAGNEKPTAVTFRKSVNVAHRSDEGVALKTRKSAILVGSALEMLECSTDEVNADSATSSFITHEEDSCDLMELGFADIIPAAKPKNDSQTIRVTSKTDTHSSPLSNEEALKTLNNALTCIQKDAIQGVTDAADTNPPEKERLTLTESPVDSLSDLLGLPSATRSLQKTKEFERFTQKSAGTNPPVEKFSGVPKLSSTDATWPVRGIVGFGSNEPPGKQNDIGTEQKTSAIETLPELGFVGFVSNEPPPKQNDVDVSGQRPSRTEGTLPELGFVGIGSSESPAKQNDVGVSGQKPSRTEGTLPELGFVGFGSNEPPPKQNDVDVSGQRPSRTEGTLPELGFVGFGSNEPPPKQNEVDVSGQRPSRTEGTLPELGFVGIGSSESPAKQNEVDVSGQKPSRTEGTLPELGFAGVGSSESPAKQNDVDVSGQKPSRTEGTLPELGFVGFGSNEPPPKQNDVDVSGQRPSRTEGTLPELGFVGFGSNEPPPKQNEVGVSGQRPSRTEGTLPELGFAGVGSSESPAKQNDVDVSGQKPSRTEGTLPELGFVGFGSNEPPPKQNDVDVSGQRPSRTEGTLPELGFVGFGSNEPPPKQNEVGVSGQRPSRTEETLPELGFEGVGSSESPAKQNDVDVSGQKPSRTEGTLPELGFVGVGSSEPRAKQTDIGTEQKTSAIETLPELGLVRFSSHELTSNRIAVDFAIQKKNTTDERLLELDFVKSSRNQEKVSSSDLLTQSENQESEWKKLKFKIGETSAGTGENCYSELKKPILTTSVSLEQGVNAVPVDRSVGLSINAEDKSLEVIEQIPDEFKNTNENERSFETVYCDSVPTDVTANELSTEQIQEAENLDPRNGNEIVTLAKEGAATDSSDNQQSETFQTVPDRIPSPPPIPENGEIGLIVLPEKLPFAFYFDGVNMIPGLVSVPGKEDGVESQDESETDASLVIDEDCNSAQMCNDVIICDDVEMQAEEGMAVQSATHSIQSAAFPSVCFIREGDEVLESEVVEEDEMEDEVVIHEELSCDGIETEITCQDDEYEESIIVSGGSRSVVDEPFIPKIRRRTEPESFGCDDYDSMSENNFTVRH